MGKGADAPPNNLDHHASVLHWILERAEVWRGNLNRRLHYLVSGAWMVSGDGRAVCSPAVSCVSSAVAASGLMARRVLPRSAPWGRVRRQPPEKQRGREELEAVFRQLLQPI